MLTPPPPCPAVTWSIDTTGLPHPGRTTVAARRAVAEWSTMTGIPFTYQPAGGVVSIVFRHVDPKWLAYTLSNSIVVDPVIGRAYSGYQREVLAHELGHVLGIDHTGDGLMSGDSTHVAAADAALAVCPQPSRP